MLSLLIAPGAFPRPSLAVGKAYSSYFWRPARAGEWLDVVVAVLIWPFAIAFCALWFTAKNGPVVARRLGPSIWRQLRDQVVLALTTGLLPPWYYIFELYQPGAMRRSHAFLTRGQTKYGVYRILATARRSSSPLGDKERFAQFCAERQLAALPVLLSVHEGELRGDARVAAALPAADLFVKPVSGRGGKGAERWDYAGNRDFRNRAGLELSDAQFLEQLRAKSRAEPYLVQRRALNHPALHDLSNGALNTLRIISCLDEQDRPEIVAAVLRMAVGGNVTVDNVHAGGLAACVDLVQGRLSPATDMGVDARLGWIDRHPDTGARIAGRVLPFWGEVRELVRKAHFAFSDWAVVGWDVAIMADAPRLVEGNSGPDVDLVQRPLQKAFGDSRFGELLAFQLRRVQGAQRAPSLAFAAPLSPGKAWQIGVAPSDASPPIAW